MKQILEIDEAGPFTTSGRDRHGRGRLDEMIGGGERSGGIQRSELAPPDPA